MGRREAHNLVPLGFAFRELRFFGALRCAFTDTELAASARARMAQNMSMLRSAAVSETWQTRCNRQTVLNKHALHRAVAGVDRNNNTPTDHVRHCGLACCTHAALLPCFAYLVSMVAQTRCNTARRVTLSSVCAASRAGGHQLPPDRKRCMCRHHRAW